MARQGKPLSFDPLEVEDLLDIRYGGARTYALLALLYPGIDVRNTFHLDHVYPRSKFTAARLRAAGIEEELIPRYLDRCDRLANLQLLEGTENVDKRAALPAEWVQRAYPDIVARSGYLARNDLGPMPALDGFLEFDNDRRVLMRQRLLDLLGVDPAAAAEVQREAANELHDTDAAADLRGTASKDRRDIAAHIVSAFMAEPPGTFLTIGEIRAHRSPEYGDEFPSAGAIAARLFPGSGVCTVPGVEPGVNERGVRGSRKGTT